MKELEAKDNARLLKLSTMEINKATGVAEKFRLKYGISKEFGLTAKENVLFVEHFARYFILKREYRVNYALIDPVSAFIAQLPFLGIGDEGLEEVRNMVLEEFETAIEEDTVTIERLAKEKGMSSKIQNLANCLSNSFLAYPHDSKRIKSDIALAKLN